MSLSIQELTRRPGVVEDSKQIGFLFGSSRLQEKEFQQEK